MHNGYTEKLSNWTLTKKNFIPFVYGYNEAALRMSLWGKLVHISHHCIGAWGVIDDVNSILNEDDRIGGRSVSVPEIIE